MRFVLAVIALLCVGCCQQEPPKDSVPSIEVCERYYERGYQDAKAGKPFSGVRQ